MVSRRLWDSGRNPDSSARPGISIDQGTTQDNSGWETEGGVASPRNSGKSGPPARRTAEVMGRSPGAASPH